MGSMNWMDVQGLEAPSSRPQGEPGEPGETAEADRLAPETLLEGLNEPQRRAVTHGEGPLLILAGAGSGKTRVITTRIAWLISQGGVDPYQVLAITFTNKAAREMRTRVERLIARPGLWISTFHSTCARILRREIEALGGWTRDFTIYDTYDRNQLLKELIKDAGYDVTRFRPAAVGGWISNVKNRAALDPGDPEGGSFQDEVLQKILAAYGAAMRKNNALDFDDLLLLALELFEKHPGVRDVYSSRFRYVLVDEYQDTNRVQYELTRHLAGGHGNLAVCGDPDQSIYSWRGADIRNILDFEADFGSAEVVKLEQNYRSTRNVLRAAQAVIRHNAGRKEKDLWSEREDGEPIRVVECADENDEADEIVRRVRAAREDGRSLEDVAVFYRVNFMQRAIERALRLEGVPYRIVAGLEFYQRREIRDLIAYLRLVVNPTDDVACARIVNVPQRGIGAKSLEHLAAFAAERGLSLRRALASEEGRATVRGRARKGLLAFHQVMEQLEDLREAPAAEVLARVLLETDYLAWLGELGDAEQRGREENVDELCSHAETYDRENPEGRLPGYLQDVALVSDVDGPPGEDEEEDAERVTLMTLHAAKGLEFPVVVIAGLEEELLPHGRALAESAGEDDALEEERRLLYVGMTRAMDSLVLTWAGRRLHYGEFVSRLPSRFLQELPDELIEDGGFPAEDGDPLGEYEPEEHTVVLAVGARVVHDHFGLGVVERLQGMGVNARATVRFARHGSKQLLLQYANLRLQSDE